MPRPDPRTHPKMRAKMWKKGQSGNPEGRPPKRRFEDVVAEVLEEQIPGTDVTKFETLARVFVTAMLKGDRSLIREFLAREYPVKKQVEVTGADGRPLELSWLDLIRAEREDDGEPE